jgi:hypothetical protein
VVNNMTMVAKAVSTSHHGADGTGLDALSASA